MIDWIDPDQTRPLEVLVVCGRDIATGSIATTSTSRLAGSRAKLRQFYDGIFQGELAQIDAEIARLQQSRETAVKEHAIFLARIAWYL